MLGLRGISKTFPGVHALRDVSFDIARGDIHAIVGENGAGKSTLMRILSGVYTNYDGQILLDGEPVHLSGPRDAQGRGIAIIHQELNLVRELSVAGNIYLGREPRTPWGTIDNRQMETWTQELLASLDLRVSPRQRVGDLRVGEQQMVEIAKALSFDARILILDEPTSALSSGEIDTLFAVVRTLRERGVTMLYISHKFDEVFALSDQVTVLRDGQFVSTRVTSETNQAELIRLMVGRPLTDLFPKESAEVGNPVLSVRDLSLNAPTGSTRRSLYGIDLDVRTGEIVGVAGLMGSGRTELLESIYGVHPLSWRSGEIAIDGTPCTIRHPRAAIAHGMAFVTEDRKSQSLFLGLPVANNITMSALSKVCRGGVVMARREAAAVAEFIRAMRIRTPSAQVAVGNLSGGNQQKVALAKCLMTKPRVLLLDEPTRGIDIGAKAEIYTLMSQLAQQGTGIVMVSSELPELLAMCDRIVVLWNGRVAGEVSGNEATQESIMRLATGALDEQDEAA